MHICPSLTPPPPHLPSPIPPLHPTTFLFPALTSDNSEAVTTSTIALLCDHCSMVLGKLASKGQHMIIPLALKKVCSTNEVKTQVRFSFKLAPIEQKLD